MIRWYALEIKDQIFLLFNWIFGFASMILDSVQIEALLVLITSGYIVCWATDYVVLMVGLGLNWMMF